MEGCYKNPEAIEAIQNFSLFLYRCAEAGDLSVKQIRKLMFLSEVHRKIRDEKEKSLFLKEIELN